MNEKKRLQLYRKFPPLSDKDLAIIELSHGQHLTKEARQAIRGCQQTRPGCLCARTQNAF